MTENLHRFFHIFFSIPRTRNQSRATSLQRGGHRNRDSQIWDGNFRERHSCYLEAEGRDPPPICCKTGNWLTDLIWFDSNTSIFSQDVEIKEEGARHVLILFNCKKAMAGSVDFLAANAKSSAQLRVKGDRNNTFFKSLLENDITLFSDES